MQAIVCIVALLQLLRSGEDVRRYWDRMNDVQPGSHRRPPCAWMFRKAKVRTDKLDPGGDGESLFISHPWMIHLKPSLLFRTLQQDYLQRAFIARLRCVASVPYEKRLGGTKKKENSPPQFFNIFFITMPVNSA